MLRCNGARLPRRVDFHKPILRDMADLGELLRMIMTIACINDPLPCNPSCLLLSSAPQSGAGCAVCWVGSLPPSCPVGIGSRHK